MPASYIIKPLWDIDWTLLTLASEVLRGTLWPQGVSPPCGHITVGPSALTTQLGNMTHFVHLLTRH